MKSKIIIWILIFLFNLISIVAYHGGGKTGGQITPSPTVISPIGLMIFVVLFIGIGYLIYWLFSNKKKKF